MRYFDISIKKIAASVVMVCLLMSVTGFISIAIIKKADFGKSAQLFENYVNSANDCGEEKDNEEPNEANDYFIHPDVVQLSPDILPESVVFLYTITGAFNNFADVHCPPPRS